MTPLIKFFDACYYNLYQKKDHFSKEIAEHFGLKSFWLKHLL